MMRNKVVWIGLNNKYWIGQSQWTILKPLPMYGLRTQLKENKPQCPVVINNHNMLQFMAYMIMI